jgi:hypothetical protein
MQDTLPHVETLDISQFTHMQELITEKLKTQGSRGSLCFGMVARSSTAGDVVAVSQEIPLHDLRTSQERSWMNVKLPLFSERINVYVADLNVSIVAKRALEAIWASTMSND